MAVSAEVEKAVVWIPLKLFRANLLHRAGLYAASCMGDYLGLRKNFSNYYIWIVFSNFL